ncbi:Short chain dehydrogenase AgnL6 [Paramyrothecium foliicola]|nr:Short chain dehydrogenase AgnL6 [Paramyrothecium foliicola]
MKWKNLLYKSTPSIEEQQTTAPPDATTTTTTTTSDDTTAKMSLKGKVILITGSSNGIGKACIERVASEGASVVINYFSNADAANAMVQAIGSDRAIAVQADVSKLEDNARLVDEAVKKFGKIDTIVLNAAIMPMKSLQDSTEADFDSIFNMNVKGPYFMTQRAVPHMPPGSRIIFVSSGVCHFSSVAPNYLLYAATKGAIEQITRVLSKGLGSAGINVNAIAPGPTATELFFRGKPEGLVNTLKGASPFNRLGEPAEIANMVNFLAGEESSWVHGQTLLINGGVMV